MSLIDINFYTENIKNRNINLEKINGKKPTYIQRTYGCQMNEHDTEHVEFTLENLNFEKSKTDTADLIFINTCAIRQSAADKAYGFIGSLKTLKEENPDIILIVSGCLPELEDDLDKLVNSYKHIDVLMGTSSYSYLAKYIYDCLDSNKTIVGGDDQYNIDNSNINYNRLYKHKSFVNIAYGCNNFCSYCIVPYTRGREDSRPIEDIYNQIKNLVDDGVKEVTLLGQNVNSYGKTLRPQKTFTDLLEKINTIEGLERIRFMTSHPKDISKDLIGSFKRPDKLSNHLHLPIQAGSDKVLREMNRGYKADDYLKIIENVRSVSPDISLSTDIMVGFPGETEEDFQQTLEIVEKVSYDFVFTFLYSPREGTKASLREDQIDQEIKTQRFNRLVDLINQISYEKNQKLIGQEFDVLVDEVSKSDKDYLSGRTDGFKLVNFKGNEDLIGEMVRVEIISANTFALEGKLI